MADLVTYDPAQAFLSRFSKYGREQAVANAKQKYDELLQSKTAQSLKGRAGMIGAGLAGTAIVGSQLQQQQPMGAVIGGIGSTVGGIVGTLGRKTALGKLIGGGIGAGIGGLLGEGSEIVKAAVTGAGKGTAPGGTEAPLFGPNNIPLNEAARRYAYETQLMDRDFGYSKQMLGSEVAAQKDLIQHQFQQQLQYSKSLDPLVQSGLDKHLVRSQALLNTQGNIDTRLGILATQGALAKGAQAEAGALARTMASTNPYIQAAVRQSPNIQFG